MRQTARLLLGLLGGQVDLVREHTKTRATHIALLAGFGLVGTVFLLVFITAALADWIGPLPALAVMAVIFLGAALVVALRMRTEQRRYEHARRLQRAEQVRVAQTALWTALPALRAGGVVTAGLAGFAVALLLGRKRRGG